MWKKIEFLFIFLNIHFKSPWISDEYFKVVAPQFRTKYFYLKWKSEWRNLKFRDLFIKKILWLNSKNYQLLGEILTLFFPFWIFLFSKNENIGCKFFYDRNVDDFYELFQIKSKPNALQKSNQVYFGPFTCNFK